MSSRYGVQCRVRICFNILTIAKNLHNDSLGLEEIMYIFSLREGTHVFEVETIFTSTLESPYILTLKFRENTPIKVSSSSIVD